MKTINKKKMDIQTLLLLILIGLASGVLGGMVGVGGGIVIVPALVYFLGFSQLEAQGTSLAMILLPVGILGVIQYYKAGYVDVKYVMLLALGFVIGGYLGSRISLSVSQDVIKKVFAILLLVIGIKMLFFDKRKTGAESNAPATSASNIKK